MSYWSDLADSVNSIEAAVFGSTVTYQRNGEDPFEIDVIARGPQNPDETDLGNFTFIEIQEVDFAASPLPEGPANGDVITVESGDQYVVFRFNDVTALSRVYQIYLHAA